MQYRNLGRSALKVSELCLGTMNFGPRTEEAVAFEMLDLAVSAGVNFIDTADQYGGAPVSYTHLTLPTIYSV